jgi:hypothetical protein
MRIWLSARKNLPPNLPTATPSETATPDTEGEQRKGAGGALARLEKAELTAYRRLQDALVGGDPVTIKQARSSWLLLCEQLRKYESAVAADKRAAGMLVPRDEIERALRTLATCMHIGSEQATDGMVLQIMGEKEAYMVSDLIRKCFYNVAAVSYAGLVATDMPQWIIEALSSHFTNATTTTPADIQRLGEAVRSFVKEMTPAAIQQAR